MKRNISTYQLQRQWMSPLSLTVVAAAAVLKYLRCFGSIVEIPRSAEVSSWRLRPLTKLLMSTWICLCYFRWTTSKILRAATTTASRPPSAACAPTTWSSLRVYTAPAAALNLLATVNFSEMPAA